MMNNQDNVIPHATSALRAPPPVAWIGLDWGHRQHAFALQDRTGHAQEGTLAHSAENLHTWLRGLAHCYGGRPVALALEARPPALMPALEQYPWLVVYPVNPVTSARYRRAFTPSGASDDLPDARMLLELVREHAAKLRVFQPQDQQTLQLAGLTQARREWVDRRTSLLNELSALLRGYYPQALELLGNLGTVLALEFLRRWPDLLSLKAARPSTVQRFFYAHNLRRPELLEKRLRLIAQAVCLTTDQARLRVAVLKLHCLLDQLRVLHKHLPVLDREIKNVFATHPEAYLFRNLPGAGPALAPRLCVAFGTDRTLFPNPASLQQFAGLAPVREKSGQQLWTHWRWFAPVFVRQTFVEWAGQTVVYSAWAKVFYQRMKAKGKTHAVILRALAFRWIRILWKCWQTHTRYDEARYLHQLRHRQSPNASAA